MNAGETKIMQCQVSKGQVEASGKDPNSVCSKVVCSNSVLWVECHSFFFFLTQFLCQAIFIYLFIEMFFYWRPSL